MTSEPTRQEHDAMTTLDRNRTTFSESSEPSEPKDDEMPDDELSVIDVLKRSFPSGHTAAAFVIYGSLVFVARSLSSQSSATQSSATQSSATQSWSARSISRAVWLVPPFLALLVAVARVYEGVHYPTDVAAGLLLGAVVAASVATGLTDLRDISARTR